MKVVVSWMLVAGQPEVFQLPLWCLLGFVVLFHIPWLLEYVHFLDLLEKS